MSDAFDRNWDGLLGDLYTAFLDPDAAARLPDAVARAVGGVHAAIWTVDGRTGAQAGRMVSNIPAESRLLYASHYQRLDPWTTQAARMPPNSAVHGASLVDEATVASSAYYNEFGRTFGHFHVVGAVLPLHPDAHQPIGAISVFRPRGRYAFSAEEAARLERLLPHVRRALQVASIAGAAALDSATAAVDAMLEALGTPAAVLDGAGRVLRANGALERLDAAGTGPKLRGPRGDTGIAAGLADQSRRLRAAAASAASGGPGGAVRFSMGADGATLLAVVSPLPASLAALPGLGPGLALLLLRPLGIVDDAQARRLARLFGLTPAEAEVALALAGGLGPKEIAEARGVRVSTVRTLIQRAQDKAGARSTRELASMAAALRW